jgi:hypothetical protein
MIDENRNGTQAAISDSCRMPSTTGCLINSLDRLKCLLQIAAAADAEFSSQSSASFPKASADSRALPAKLQSPESIAKGAIQRMGTMAEP